MKRPRGGIIASIKPESIAQELGLQPGDRITAINGHPLEDYLDYRFHLADPVVEVAVIKTNGEEWLLDIEKDPDDDLGITFESQVFDGIRVCRNRCLFCFVEQMPKGLRRPLYLKDDDYRLSFLHGNFITLTNLSAADWQRIKEQRLSPLYVSVHAVDPDLRAELMGSPQAGQILEQLQELTAAGISIHAQVVLCPGLNDGPQLEKTVQELSQLWPGVRSLAVVPVGLTRHRAGLYPLRPFTKEEARAIIRQANLWQEDFRRRFGYTFLFLADEFYILADEDFPPYETYEDFPQWENGVGLAADFLRELRELTVTLPAFPPAEAAASPEPWTLVTGRSAQGLIAEMAAVFQAKVPGLNLSVLAVENRLFGPTVTVAGLLTGRDIEEAAKGLRSRALILPEVMLREGRFLDDLTADDLARRLGIPVVAVPAQPRGLADFLWQKRVKR